MRRHSVAALTGTVISLLSACQHQDSRQQALDPAAQKEIAEAESARQELAWKAAESRQCWNERRPHSYSCTISSRGLGPEGVARIAVRGNEIRVLSRNVSAALAVGFPISIDHLFEVIETELERSAHKVSAEFDPAYCYPRTIGVDPKRLTNDEEYSYSVTEFECGSN